MSKRTFWTVFTLLFMVFGAIGGIWLATNYMHALSTGRWPWIHSSEPAPAGVPDTAKLPATIAFGVGGMLVAFLVWTFVFAEMQRVRHALDTMSPHDKVAGMAGIFLGLVLTGLIVASFNPPTWLTFTLALLLCYLGVAASLSMKESIKLFFPNAPTQGKAISTNILRPKILDTNVIIDGRIADICKAGFIEGPIYIPRFVLEELQQIADSSDSLKRARGRRGLDILNQMQQEMSLKIETYDSGNGEAYPEEVDGKLVELAKDINGIIVTNDYNLNKVAALHGIGVLNVNELANAMKPVVLPGEMMSTAIIKEGKEQNQGVGYLDDGTMIVVEGGRKHVGETLDVVVTSVLQTAAGKMIFANIRSDYQEEESAIEQNVRDYSGSRPRKKIR